MDELTIIAENLADADRLLADSWILRSSHLAELADVLHKRLTGDEDAEEILTSLYGEFNERLAERAPQSATKERTRMISLFTRLELCRSLAEKRPEVGIPPWENPHPMIAYFQNPYAGRVLQGFTDALGGGEAIAAEDYTDACEGVSDGRYDFCVLPVESARDGTMSRFVQMIDRYDLFTVLTCHLEIGEEEYIRFALLAASPCCLPKTQPAYLQLKVVTGEEQLWELLFVAHQLGAELAGCRFLPGETAVYQLTLGVKDANIAALHYYLEMGWSRSTFTGFYAELLPDDRSGKGILY